MRTKPCEECEEEFEYTNSRAKYCSAACRNNVGQRVSAAGAKARAEMKVKQETDLRDGLRAFLYPGSRSNV